MSKLKMLVLSLVLLCSQKSYLMDSYGGAVESKRPGYENIPDDLYDDMVFPDQILDSYGKRYKRYFTKLPDKLKTLIASLKLAHQFDECMDDQERVIILVGPSSAGKTEGCKAIAYELGWPYLDISAASLGTTYQNSAIQNMKRILEPLLEKQCKCVVIFDEMTALTKGARAASDQQVLADRDTEQYKTACQLNKILDRIRVNQNVLFFGLTNEQEFLTDAIQERSKVVACESMPESRIVSFKEGLQETQLKLGDDVGEWIDSNEERITNFTYRNIESVIKGLKRICLIRRSNSSSIPVITSEDVESIFVEIEEEIEIAKKSANKKTEEQLRHEEQVALSKKQIELQEASVRMQNAQYDRQRNINEWRAAVKFSEVVHGRPAPAFMHAAADEGCIIQ